MDWLTAFGLFAVAMMLVCYALEDISTWFILAFAIACCLASAYGFMQGAWPFGLVEAIWAVVACRRWWVKRRNDCQQGSDVKSREADSQGAKAER